MKKVLSFLIALAVIIAPQAGFAQTTAQITASGTLGGDEASLTIFSGDTINFSPVGNELLVEPETVVTINFTDNNPGYQGVVISTDNGAWDHDGDGDTDDVSVGAGLVGQSDPSEVAPLYWKVFAGSDNVNVTYEVPDGTGVETLTATIPGYANYSFNGERWPQGTSFDNNTPDNPNDDKDISGTLVAPYVVDKTASNIVNWRNHDVSGYATVLGNIKGTAVENATAECTMYVPRKDEITDFVGEVNAAFFEAISAKEGTAYIKLAADFTGLSSQTYTANNLYLELVRLD